MKCILNALCLLLSTLMFFSTAALAEDNPSFKSNPMLNEGKRWRIAYYEGGEYIDYQQEFTATIGALMKKGWIEPKALPHPSGEATKPLWHWLATEVKSDYIEFVQDAHYSAAWDEEQRLRTVNNIFERLNKKKDIDLMLAFGTWAGKDMATNKHRTSTLIISSSDPLAAGIIHSLEDSGFDHVHANIDPYLYKRQIRTFHDLVGFKRLGIAYEDTEVGRSYAAIKFVKMVSQERGFEVVHCHTKSDIKDKRLAEKTVINCFNSLINEVDAIYVTHQGGVTINSIPVLLQIANKNKIPTFSQSGAAEVRNGFLFSYSRSVMRYIGAHNANNIGKVLNGISPNKIPLIFEEPLKLSINIKTAKAINFNPSQLFIDIDQL